MKERNDKCMEKHEKQNLIYNNITKQNKINSHLLIKELKEKAGK